VRFSIHMRTNTPAPKAMKLEALKFAIVNTILELLVLTVFLSLGNRLCAQTGQIIRISDDPDDDVNPQIIVDNEDRIWIFWESERSGTWNIYARYVERGMISDLTTITRNTPEKSGHYAVTIDSKGDIWVAWCLNTYEPQEPGAILIKKYDGFQWSTPDTICCFGFYPAMCSGIDSSVWIFWRSGVDGEGPHIWTRYYDGSSWGDSTIVLYGTFAGVYYEFYDGPLKATGTQSNIPWVLCMAHGHVSGNIDWDTVTAAFYQDTCWSKVKVASGYQPYDIGTDNSGQIYIAYTSYCDTAGIKNYLKSYSGSTEEFVKKWTLEKGRDFSLSDNSDNLAITWSYHNSVFAQIMMDTLLSKPKLIYADSVSTISYRQKPVLVLDNLSNIWIAWQALVDDEKDIFVTSIPCTTFTAVSSGISFSSNQFLSPRLFQNYPNPFNASTIICYELSQPSFVILEIYNLLGQRVRTLVNERKLPGIYRVSWNGCDNKGKQLTSGLYLCRLQVEGFIKLGKVVFQR